MAVIERSFLSAVGAFLIFLLVMARHRDNLKRLLSGTERKLGEKLNG
jgi:glycerol-3-phosphate acyltransferase PlsY